jgi:hypothetical protein
MRAAVTPQITSEPSPEGYYFTYIELPKGEYVKKPGASAPVHTAKPTSKVIGKPTSAVSGTGSSSSSSREGTWTEDGHGVSTFRDGSGHSLQLTEIRR